VHRISFVETIPRAVPSRVTVLGGKANESHTLTHRAAVLWETKITTTIYHVQVFAKLESFSGK